ncbi:MAG: radical SAM family heme chaperone HemW [Synergistaceae bacterium]|nr:radical SAM family heme chaperone HemW [Synergistaceae bacterium]
MSRYRRRRSWRFWTCPPTKNSKNLSLYVHVPFCVAKCPYCAFASAPARAGDEEPYLESLEREIALRAENTPAIATLYVGGGTPSVLSLASWHRLIEIIERGFSFSEGAEVTVEANPGSLDRGHVELWREWRVTRISVGVQSFDDRRLKFLGRGHDAKQARAALALCMDAAFSVSLDMMFGLPEETLRDWMTDLKTALSFGTSHISVYQLTIEEGTPLARENPALPEGYAQYRYAQWRLVRAGLEQYEVASFARPGHECRHNLNCWDDGEYIGLGPSACGCVDGVRWMNAPRLDDYAAMTLRGLPTISEERLEGKRAARQAAVLALRTKRGIIWKNFAKRYGAPAANAIRRDLERFPGDIVENGAEASMLTQKGFRLGNTVWSEII